MAAKTCVRAKEVIVPLALPNVLRRRFVLSPGRLQSVSSQRSILDAEEAAAGEQQQSTLLHGSVVRRRGSDGVSGPLFRAPWAATVPFKANQDRRHHTPKQRHRVTNWAAYHSALRARDRECQVCNRLPAGGRRIRTLGPP